VAALLPRLHSSGGGSNSESWERSELPRSAWAEQRLQAPREPGFGADHDHAALASMAGGGAGRGSSMHPSLSPRACGHQHSRAHHSASSSSTGGAASTATPRTTQRGPASLHPASTQPTPGPPTGGPNTSSWGSLNSFDVNNNDSKLAHMAARPEVERLEDALDALFDAGAPFMGRYELLGAAERRAGGQGVVQFARLPHNGRQVALKVRSLRN
jgi:hypothetical protein